MIVDLGGRIVVGWACDQFGMPTFHVHQTDYAEIEAKGRTPAEACVRLIALLVEAIDFASEAWRLLPLELAIVDARGFDRSFTAGGCHRSRGDQPWNASEES